MNRKILLWLLATALKLCFSVTPLDSIFSEQSVFSDIVIDQNGKIAAINAQEFVLLWQFGKTIDTIEAPGIKRYMAFSRDGLFLSWRDKNWDLYQWDLQHGVFAYSPSKELPRLFYRDVSVQDSLVLESHWDGHSVLKRLGSGRALEKWEGAPIREKGGPFFQSEKSLYILKKQNVLVYSYRDFVPVDTFALPTRGKPKSCELWKGTQLLCQLLDPDSVFVYHKMQHSSDSWQGNAMFRHRASHEEGFLYDSGRKNLLIQRHGKMGSVSWPQKDVKFWDAKMNDFVFEVTSDPFHALFAGSEGSIIGFSPKSADLDTLCKPYDKRETGCQAHLHGGGLFHCEDESKWKAFDVLGNMDATNLFDLNCSQTFFEGSKNGKTAFMSDSEVAYFVQTSPPFKKTPAFGIANRGLLEDIEFVPNTNRFVTLHNGNAVTLWSLSSGTDGN